MLSLPFGGTTEGWGTPDPQTPDPRLDENLISLFPTSFTDLKAILGHQIKTQSLFHDLVCSLYAMIELHVIRVMHVVVFLLKLSRKQYSRN